MALSAFVLKARNAQKSINRFDGKSRKSQSGQVKHGPFPQWVSGALVLTCLVLSAVTFYYADKNIRLNAMLEFRKISVDAEEKIKLKVISYGQVLTGVTAHMGAHVDDEVFGSHEDHTTDDEGFENYVSSLDIKHNFPGILGIGLVGYGVHEDDRSMDEMVLRGRGKNYVGPISHPPVSNMAITHIAPFHRNEEMLNLDLGAEKSCRVALGDSWESKATKLTPHLSILNEGTRELGFFLVRAIYAPQVISHEGDVIEDRFLGWTMASFAARSLMEELGPRMGNDYNLTLFDGEQGHSGNIVLESAHQDEVSGNYVHQSHIQLFGRTWILKFTSTPAFDATYQSFLPTALLMLGLSISVLLWFALKYNALRGRVLASLAEHRERQLDARRDENRTLLETNVLAVMTLDKDSKVTFANSTALALFGVVENELIGQPFSMFISLYSHVNAVDIANAIGKGANEAPLLLDVQTSRWRTADKQIQTTALIRDVTEHVTSRLTLEAVQERYDIALAGAGIGVFEVNLKEGTAIVSETSRRIMGGELQSEKFDQERDFFSRVHPDDLPLLKESDRKCIEGDTERSMVEYRLRFPDGWRWMYTDAVSVGRGADGRADRLIGTQRDITDVRHSRNALEVSEARFRMMMEEAPVGTAVLDEKGSFIKVNKALATLTGYDVERLELGMRLADLLSRKDYVQMSRDIRGFLKSGEARAYQNQFQLKTHGGELRWGLFNFSWTFDKNRNEYVYIVQVIDITEQKRIEKAKGEFIATVSHELRTPLTSVKGALGLLEASAVDTLTQNAKRLLEIARVNADRLTVMVNDILDLERLKSGAIIFESEDIPLHLILEQAVDAMGAYAKEYQNTIVLSDMDSTIDVHVDVGRFRQVLTNLLSNACKFSDPETIVSVRAVAIDDEVTIYVENSGPAVPDSFRSNLFEAFTQVDASDTRSKGGTGLGLHIARQIVLRLGGDIGFEHDNDGLTTFWFSCPRSFAVMADSVDGALANTWQDGRVLQILHVEDDYDFADVISAGFGSLANVSHAANLGQARALVVAAEFDVILLDWALPDGHASALLDEIYTLLPDAVFIALSATSNVPDERIALSLTKSQTDIETIVHQVLMATANGLSTV